MVNDIPTDDLGSLIRSSRPFLAALKRAIAQDDGQKLRNAADSLICAAERGEPWAIQCLADRLDGKPKQGMEHSGPDGKSISLRVAFGRDDQVPLEAEPPIQAP